ncbi:hypothetical protein B0H15DRAFT_807348 [Mycena belliarum]|uniref:Uncharacterized protein n=1 Tax=Mycena belliarum TaxID=1033014 RepID=A0AAD6TRN6_9AGAR|nr:hypothetical protein B0H15DRAFT_807348 [Mycena belliae]
MSKDTNSPASFSENWRADPPHLSGSAADTQFESVRTHAEFDSVSASGARTTPPIARGLAATGGDPSPVPPGSPSPGTASPRAVSGLTAKLVADGTGGFYLVQVETGLRIDFIDDESIPAPEDVLRAQAANGPGSDRSAPTVSDTSDMVFTRVSDPAVSPELQRGADAALPPRRAGETTDDFDRRAAATLNRRERAAAAFTEPRSDLGNPGIRAGAPTAHFEDIGSISTAMNRPPRTNASARMGPGPGNVSHTGYLTSNDNANDPSDVFEEFRNETDDNIRRIVDRQLGEELVLPVRVKPPKLDTPRKFTGVDDHMEFIRWLERTVSWMRTMFYGGPDIDEYRVTVLKSLLEGVALDWYIDFVENEDSDVHQGFVDILCSLHRRFITTATAHHALRDFDAIRYRAEDGPLRLMDELETCSRRMREPMPEVIIRQRFMRQIPPELHDDLMALRGISPTYSSIQQMRDHASQLWEAGKTSRGGRGRATATHAPRAELPKTSVFPKRTTPDTKNCVAGPPAGHPTGHLPGPRPTPRVGTGLHSEKTCFKCGVLGHIGSDPICSKYNDPAPSRPRLGAQRVYDSYAADDNELNLGDDEYPVDDNWGGLQYEGEGDPEEPEHGPDLANLAEAAELGEPRLGTIRFQYYALRVAADDEVGTTPALEMLSALPLSLRAPGHFGSMAAEDCQTIERHRASRGLRPFTVLERERVTTELRRDHHYVDDPVESFAMRAEAFERRHGEGAWPRSVADEWDALLRLSMAENIRDIRRHTSLAAVALAPEPTALEIGLMTIDELAPLMDPLVRRIDQLRGMRNCLSGVNTLGRDALAKIDERLRMPRGSTSRACTAVISKKFLQKIGTELGLCVEIVREKLDFYLHKALDKEAIIYSGKQRALFFPWENHIGFLLKK